MMLAAIRLRGAHNRSQAVEDTFHMLGMTKKHTLAVMKDTPTVRGMLLKIEALIAWGEVDDAYAGQFAKPTHLKPPRGGFKTLKVFYPKGDLGYRGDTIKDLIERMR